MMNPENPFLFTPDYTHLTGLLKHLNSQELKDILNSDEKSDAIVKDLKQIKDIEAEKEIIIASNKSISEYNLSKKSILKEYTKQIEDTYKIANELKSKFCDAKDKLDQNKTSQTGETLLALLQAATAESEEAAEATVEFFLKNELSVEDFLEKYLEQRKLSYLRRHKVEKLIKILEEQGSQVNRQPMRPQRLRKPPAPPAPVTSSALPYPTSNLNVMSPNNIPPMPARQAPQPPMQMNPQQRYPGYYPPVNNPRNPYPYNYQQFMPYAGPSPVQYQYFK